MSHAGGRLRVEDVAGRCLEELEYRGVLERRRVRPVDPNPRAGGGWVEPPPGRGVAAGGGGPGGGPGTVGDGFGAELGPDQPGPADDDDLHDGNSSPAPP